MLARPETRRCVECGLPYGMPGFSLHYGRLENGPAYWCDEGILCSPACSLAQVRRRAASGTLPTAPAPDPFDLDGR